MRILISAGLAVAGLLFPIGFANGGTAEGSTGVPAFRVEGTHVDPKTFNGFRHYGNSCQACHGPDATGSSFAPALAESLKKLDYATFVKTVRDGRQGGENSVMPSFAVNDDVTSNLDDIYRYLAARAKGGLGRGRPQKIGQ